MVSGKVNANPAHTEGPDKGMLLPCVCGGSPSGRAPDFQIGCKTPRQSNAGAACYGYNPVNARASTHRTSQETSLVSSASLTDPKTFYRVPLLRGFFSWIGSLDVNCNSKRSSAGRNKLSFELCHRLPCAVSDLRVMTPEKPFLGSLCESHCQKGGALENENPQRRNKEDLKKGGVSRAKKSVSLASDWPDLGMVCAEQSILGSRAKCQIARDWLDQCHGLVMWLPALNP